MVDEFLSYLDDGYIPAHELMLEWLVNTKPWITNSLKNLLCYTIDVSYLYIMNLTEYDIPLGSISIKDDGTINLELSTEEINFLFNSSGLLNSILSGKGVPKGKQRSHKEIKDLISRLDNLTEIPTNYKCGGSRITIPKLIKSYKYYDTSNNVILCIDMDFIELMYTWYLED